MLRFQLFRIKVLPTAQRLLFPSGRSGADILRYALRSVPSAELRRGALWHVGNVEELGDDGVYFRVGRTTTTTLQVYQDGAFEDAEFETAPYTHVVVDTRLEVCGIAEKTRLAPSTVGIANRLTRLLNQSRAADEEAAMFQIAQVDDPEGLLMHLRAAYRVSTFWVGFSRPNPFHPERDFYVPMEKLLEESQGETGKTELKGEDLNAAVLEELTRCAAATGNDAGASLQEEEGGAKVKKRLKRNPVVIPAEDVTEPAHKLRLLELLRRAYHRVRGDRGNHES